MHSSHEMVVTFLKFFLRQPQTCQLKLFGCLPHPGFYTCFCNHPKQLHLKNTKKQHKKIKAMLVMVTMPFLSFIYQNLSD